MVSPRRFVVALQSMALVCGALAAAQQPSAGTSSSKTKRNAEQHVKAAASAPSAEGTGIVYRNPNFGFIYRAPYGWVDRTKQMQPDDADASQSQLLLAVFERPPEA